MRFKLWLETDYDDMMAEYIQFEPQILNNKAVQAELAQIGYVKIVTMQRALNLPTEGEATFFARMFNKRHENMQQQQVYNKQQDDIYMKTRRDDYYYHVLPTSRLQSVMKQGLKPNQSAVFSNYKNNSRGKVFLCEKEGIPFWKMRIEEHMFHNSDDEDTTSVIKIRKDLVQVQPDQVGTSDSGSPCYYITSPIPPQNIESV